MGDVMQVGSLDVRLWGKERGLRWAYPLVCHLLDTGAICLELWDGLLSDRLKSRIARELCLSREEARLVVAVWAALHDLGKISVPFQAQVDGLYAELLRESRYVHAPGAESGAREFRHEMATHWALAVLLGEAGYPVGRGRAAYGVAQLLGGHHGCFGSVPARKLAQASRYQAGLGAAGWEEQRRLHLAEVRRVVGGVAVPSGMLSAEMSVYVHGLVVLSDWLVSDVGWIDALLKPEHWRGRPDDLDAHWRSARAAAPEAARGARLGRVGFPVAEEGDFGDLFPFRPNPLQADLAECLPRLVADGGSGLVLVTAPTGDGKTEAALHAAALLGRTSDARGVYFALPTMATADAMFPRVADFAERALSGERALMLLHSGAWLSPLMSRPGFGPRAPADTWRLPSMPECQAGEGRGAAVAGVFSAGSATAVEAGSWLRQGAQRGLAAPLGVGTLDQVLRGVLPVRYGSLRLFGLADKVLVVDEAHAYGPWMQSLLVRLLEWLGAFGTSVVLLSATLAGRTATTLVEAYRRGAGFTQPVAVEPTYPGWLFVDAVTGNVSAPRQVGTNRPRTVEVSCQAVAWDVWDTAGAPVRAGGRRAALRGVLRPLAREGGTALVCCTTVAEAQRTFRDLRAAFPGLAGRPGGIRLLHSRFPGLLREEITRGCEAAYGKPDREVAPAVREGSILVATQIVEQSLDLDFDLVVSDLAPLALLLQRAGRGRRHSRGRAGRPAWAADDDRPALVVLEPVGSNGETEPPETWGDLYDHGLLLRTAALLKARADMPVAVPGDVQELVDAVYAEDFADRLDVAVLQDTRAFSERLRALDTQRKGGRLAEESLAWMTAVPAPADVDGDLSQLSVPSVEGVEELLTTRLGADSARLLCLFEQPDGRMSLDEGGRLLLPRDGVSTRAALRQLVARLVPVPGRWTRGAEPVPAQPPAWRKITTLRDVVLLPLQSDPARPCRWTGQLGTREVAFDAAEGLSERH
ncbi:CRISPR-associated endonuclease Cas3'' [Streptomyces sp. NPDC047014]|uniref:CRISPR-associated endonuclease Cas3'' n=1 Tax=Streptomyces sp. NPDC047014 TaxID=3155736 RepID=UPI0033CD4D9A